MNATATTLPVRQLQDSIVDTLERSNRLVLVAPTGSGKSTQVPQMLLDAGLAGDREIVVLQPRRVAARTLARRVAFERSTPLGREVGYQIRFEDKTSRDTRISFVTEGVLLRRLQDDPALASVGAILFDEFHERNLLSDVALGLVRRLQSTRRPDLKLVVMSATLDAEPVAAYLGEADVPATILQAEGRAHPVEIRYQKFTERRPEWELAAEKVAEVVRSTASGDVLVFMPGKGEISRTINALRSQRLSEPVELIPLHGDLSPDQQDLAFAPNPRRKVIVSTNVAETSVTIDGVTHVVDAGLVRMARFDAGRGVGTLFVEEISRASADQRAGRAGRTAPGTCHRLWTESGQLNRPERNTPEIQRADLAEVVLLLHSLGVRDATVFDWLDQPELEGVRRAERLLRVLGAIDGAGNLTDIGRQMRRLPMHPRFARMLVEAAKQGCVREAALAAALVGGRDLLRRVDRDDRRVNEAREAFEGDSVSDFHTLMRAWHWAARNHFSVETGNRDGIQMNVAREVGQTFEQLLDIAEREGLNLGKPDEQPGGPDGFLKSVLAGFVDQLARRRDRGTLECDLTENRSGTLKRESVVQDHDLFVVADIRELPARGGKSMTLLGLCSAVRIEWLDELFPGLVETRDEHVFDRTHKRVQAMRIRSLLGLVLEEAKLKELDARRSGVALARAHLDGVFELPKFNHELKQFIARVNFVARSAPELEFPAFDDEALRVRLGVAFEGLSLAKEAQAVDPGPAIRGHLQPEQREWLDELAPRQVAWTGDKPLKLLYPEQVSAEATPAPEAQVKLQDCFGLLEHPTVCEGRVPVRLWLCAPDGKRLAETTDWFRFREKEYPQLKATKLKKYPGVAWL